MVRNLMHRALRLHARLQLRDASLSEDTRKKRTAAIVVVVGVLMGFWAYGTSTSEARISWLKEHPPSDAFWSKLMNDRGFESVTDPAWWERSTAEFPLRKSTSPHIWISENRRLLLRFGQAGWEAWGLKDPHPPKPDRHLWEPLGYGWDAVDRITQLELPITRVALKFSGQPGWSDPRAVHF